MALGPKTQAGQHHLCPLPASDRPPPLQLTSRSSGRRPSSSWCRWAAGCSCRCSWCPSCRCSSGWTPPTTARCAVRLVGGLEADGPSGQGCCLGGSCSWDGGDPGPGQWLGGWSAGHTALMAGFVWGMTSPLHQRSSADSAGTYLPGLWLGAVTLWWSLQVWRAWVRLGGPLIPTLPSPPPGLCGNFNQNQADDFRTVGGVVEATAAAFANTWKTQASCPNVKNSFEDPCSLSVENGTPSPGPSAYPGSGPGSCEAGAGGWPGSGMQGPLQAGGPSPGRRLLPCIQGPLSVASEPVIPVQCPQGSHWTQGLGAPSGAERGRCRGGSVGGRPVSTEPRP